MEFAREEDTPAHSASNPSDREYERFEPLNRGSMVLNKPELRNCIHRDPFNDLSPKSNAILFGAKSKREKNPNGVPKNAK